MTQFAEIVDLIAGIGVLQCLLGVLALRRFVQAARSSPRARPPVRPPVTILKPLCGDEPLLAVALETCFAQEYPEFQIVFGAHGAGDPALAVVEDLRRRFPTRDISVVIDTTMHGSNRKLSNLINMLPFAKHEILVISDSDLHLPADYLDRLVAELSRPGTGLVTAPYFGRPSAGDDWASALAATQINHTFLPGVLMSRAMGRSDCLGSTAMFRRETLERIGGFQPLVHVLAEDNILGQRIRKLGLSVALVGSVPIALVPESTCAAVWQHEIRWVRTIRELTPLLLLASTMQHPLFWSGLGMGLAGGAPWSVGLFLGCWAIRAGCARLIDRALADQLTLPIRSTPLWLFPIRDLLSVVEIGASFLVNEVTWRGHRLGAGGVVVPAPGGAVDGPI